MRMSRQASSRDTSRRPVSAPGSSCGAGLSAGAIRVAAEDSFSRRRALASADNPNRSRLTAIRLIRRRGLEFERTERPARIGEPIVVHLLVALGYAQHL